MVRRYVWHGCDDENVSRTRGDDGHASGEE